MRLLIVSSVALLLCWTEIGCAAGERQSSLLATSTETDVEAGIALLDEYGCHACHVAADAPGKPAPFAGPVLEQVKSRLSATYLRRYLSDPHGIRPGTRMPDVLVGFGEAERTEIVEDLVHFLVSRGTAQDVEPRETADAWTIERGRQLYHSVGCVACHAPFEYAWSLADPHWSFAGEVDAEGPSAPDEAHKAEASAGSSPGLPLGPLSEGTNHSALTRFLVEPHAVRPAGRMPSLRLTEDEASDIAAYLLHESVRAVEGESVPKQDAAGLLYELYEVAFPGGVMNLAGLAASRTGTVPHIPALPDHPGDHFAFRFRGFVDAPLDGTYTFYTSSDDGSFLSIDGEQVVDNGGFHGMREASGAVELRAGRHAFEVSIFEYEGGEGLSVSWEGPGIQKQIIPPGTFSHQAYRITGREPTPELDLDPERVRRGAEHFQALGCMACHEGQRYDAPPWAALSQAPEGGCLALDAQPREAVPRFALAEGERDALHALVRASEPFRSAPSDDQRLNRTLAALRCGACHERDGTGGPGPDRREYFFVADDADLGDEGRIPPTLDGVGGKLRPSWLEAVLVDGGVARPYMKTRMPQFGRERVGHLVDLLARVDQAPGPDDEPEFELELVESGRLLAGTKGLGCIQCHTFGSYPSLGIPAVDLTRVYQRIRPAWFRQLLVDPGALKMNTRMPSFLKDGKSPMQDVLGGDVARQIDGLRIYTSLGASMPLPEGLAVSDDEYELEPLDGPLTCGVFMEGVSPRTLVVGHPERVHFAFDVQNSRLAKLWRGRFFNAQGTWHARAGQLELPPGDDVIDLPQGSPFVAEGEPVAAEEVEVLGRRYDEDRRPVFRYRVRDIEVEESLTPFLRPGGTGMLRRFRFSRPGAELVWLRVRVADGDEIDLDQDGFIVIDGHLRLRSRSGGSNFSYDQGNGKKDLLVALPASTNAFELELEYVW